MGVDVAKSGKTRSGSDENSVPDDATDDAVILPEPVEKQDPDTSPDTSPDTLADQPAADTGEADPSGEAPERPETGEDMPGSRSDNDAVEEDAADDDTSEQDNPADHDPETAGDADTDPDAEAYDDPEHGTSDEEAEAVEDEDTGHETWDSDEDTFEDEDQPEDDHDDHDDDLTEYEDDAYDTDEHDPEHEVTVQKVGLIPLVLGGGIAAGLGYIAAFFYFGQPGTDVEAMLAREADRISALEAQVAGLPTEQPDLSPILTRIDGAEAAQAELAERLDTVTAELDGQIAAFDDRLNAVERMPDEDGTLAETAIASWERELDALREQFARQEAEMVALTEQAQEDLEAARAEAEAVERSAAEATQEAVARSALSRIQAAIDTGSAFDAALSELQTAGIEVPPTLADLAADGVPTIAALREDYPAAARSALSIARAEGLADDGANPLAAFFRDQLDVRSVVPREGDDPDAILSRAEAALFENRLADALAEIETLPEPVRAEMSGWIASANARADALAAAETIDQSLSN